MASIQKRIGSQVWHIRRLLSKTHPDIFQPPNSGLVKSPLKIGIYEDLLDLGLRWPCGDPISKWMIEATIRDYCGGYLYHWGVMQAPHRIDLAGLPAGPIIPDHRVYAALRIASFQKKRGTMT